MGDAASSNFGDKDSSVFPADYGDAQWFRTFVHDDIARLLQVRPGGRKKCEGVSGISGKKKKREESLRWCNSYSCGETKAIRVPLKLQETPPVSVINKIKRRGE